MKIQKDPESGDYDRECVDCAEMLREANTECSHRDIFP